MSNRGLGTLTLSLIARIAGFTGPLSQAERAANKNLSNIEKRANAFGRSIGSSLRSAAGQFLAFAGVTATVGAALNALKGSIDLADETRDLSIQLGVSTETISEFRYAAQQTGTDMDALGKGMKILSKNAVAALNPLSSQGKVFAALGVNVTDATGKLKDLDQLVPEIADKFKGLEDGTTKAALAQALFGKSGLELTEFLNQGADGLQTMADKARALGIVISQETADAADKFNDDLSDLKASAGGLALQVAQELLPVIDDLVVSMKDFVSDGDNAKDIAHGIADGFRAMHDAGVAIGEVIPVLQGVRTVLSGLEDQAGAVTDGIKATLSGSISGIKEAVRRYREASAEVDAGFRGEAYDRTRGSQFQNVIGGSRGNVFGNVRSTSDTLSAQSKADPKALALALSNPSGTSGGRKGGKSDAQREAEQVAHAIEQMTKAQQGWQDELSKTGNPIADEYASRLREIAEQGKEFAKDGVPTDKVKAFTEEMTKLATTLRDSDIAKFQQEFNDETAEMAARMQGPAAEALQTYQEEVRKLDDLLKVGAITLSEYNDRLGKLGTVRDSPMTDVNKAIKEQIALLGMTSEQQEIYNNLKAAGVAANSAWGQSIIENTEALQQLREQTAFFDDLKEGLSDMFVDFISGAKSAKEAFGDFADQLFARALKLVADKAIQALFDAFSGDGKSSGSSGGSSGGGWSGIFSSILGAFGNGKADGGGVSAGSFYRVNERGTELLSVGGKDFLMMGANSGRVTPAHAMGGVNQVNNFNFMGRVDRRTQDQVEATLAQRSRRAVMRNG